MYFKTSIFAGAGSVGVTDGPAAMATFSNPDSITIDINGIVYVTEGSHNGIRKIEAGVVSTLASRTQGYIDGPLVSALFNVPSGLASDRAGNIYVADQDNHRIRKIDPTGNVTTVAGPLSSELLQGWADGPRAGVLFNYPTRIAIDCTAEQNIFVSELHRIRRIPVVEQLIDMVTTLAAVGIPGFADGPATLAQFNQPMGLVATQAGDIFIADAGNNRIRRVSPSGVVTTAAGDGVPADPADKSQFLDNRPALNARFQGGPFDLAIDPTGIVWVADGKHVLMYSPMANTVSTVCLDPKTHLEPVEFLDAGGIAVSDGKVYVVDNGANQIILLTPHAD